MKRKLAMTILTLTLALCSILSLTACGGNESPHTHNYSTLKYNNESHWFECECEEKSNITSHNIINGQCVCGYVVPHSHEYTELKHNETEHWYECTCGAYETKENHIPGAEATETTDQKCTECNYVIIPALGHVHTLHLTKVDAKPQSCTATGNIEYYTCSCGKWFADNTATTEITDKDSVVIEKDAHKYETLKKTATEHWWECSCGAFEVKENHKGGTATCQVKATCSVCDTVYGDFAEHEPKTAWVITDTHHYHECVYGCTVKLNYSEHSFTNYVSNNDATYESDGTKTAQCDGGCGKTNTVTDVGSMLIKDEIRFTTLTVDGKNVYGTVSNSVKKFYFDNEIIISGKANFIVSLDEDGIQSSITKSMPLSEGDNTFYVLETINGVYNQTYIITIHRREMFTVTFNTDGGSYVAPQTIEEGSLATKPNTPTKAGYDFVSWDYDFTTPITTNKTIKASWNARNDTPYRVEYYLENLENNNYSILSSATENLTGTTNTTAYAEIKTFEHFTAEKQTVSGNINGNGTTVLKVYYQRNEYTITFDGNGGTIVSGKATQTVKYGGSVTAPTFKKTGYTFDCFDKTNFTNISESFTVTANWKVNQYTLTIVYDNGQENTVLTQDYGTAIENITEPIREGYTFNGWDKEIPATMPAINTTITAKWLAIFNVSSDEITGLTTHGETLTNIIIPNKIDSVNITSIGSKAFYYCTSLTSVTIGNSVTSIGDSAFYYCNSLTSIEIPNSVTSIGNDAFWDCDSLTSIEIPDSVISIGDWAFYGCNSLTSIEIPDSVEYIGDSAFYGCSSLKYNVKDGLKYLGNESNKYLYLSDTESTKITTAVIDDNCKFIGSSAFRDCTSLTSIEIPNSVTSIGGGAFWYCDSLKSITIGDSVTSIGDDAFYECYSLRSIEIPNSVTSIGNYAFSGCYSLTSVVIGNSVTSIGGAFSSCESLTSIMVDENNENYKSIDGNLYSKDGKTLIQYAIGKTDTAFTIPNSVTSIGNSAFAYCDNLTSVTIGNSVTSIGGYAFEYCDSLTSVVIGDSVTSIGYKAFYDCSSLTSVTIGNSVTSIGDEAFAWCSSLTSIKYRGSQSEWNDIIKYYYWDYYTGNYTITYNYTGE